MFKINDNFTKLQASYLFSQVAARFQHLWLTIPE